MTSINLDAVRDATRADRAARRRAAFRAARSNAFDRLQDGDVIHVGDVPAGPSAKFPAHYALVERRADGTLRTRGLLGGGATYGTPPRNDTDWSIIGSVDVESVLRTRRLGGLPVMDAATEIARRHRDRTAS